MLEYTVTRTPDYSLWRMRISIHVECFHLIFGFSYFYFIFADIPGCSQLSAKSTLPPVLYIKSWRNGFCQAAALLFYLTQPLYLTALKEEVSDLVKHIFDICNCNEHSNSIHASSCACQF